MATFSGATPAPVIASGRTTSYLPLTTKFPSVASCSSMFVNPFTNGATQLFAFDPGYAIHNIGAPTCMPDVVTSWWEGGVAGIVTTELGGFSTMICPAMFTTALIQPRINSTLIACCPSDYDFVVLTSAPGPYQCSSIMPKGQEVTFVQADTKGVWGTTSHSWTTDSVVYGVQVNGYVFNAGVASATTSSRSSSGSSGNSTAGPGKMTATSSSAGIPSSITGTANTSSDLPMGSKVGVGIGAALVFLGLLSLVVAALLFKRRKNARLRAQEHLDASDRTEAESKAAWQKQELPGGVVHEQGGSHEVDSEERYEAPTHHPRSEMP